MPRARLLSFYAWLTFYASSIGPDIEQARSLLVGVFSPMPTLSAPIYIQAFFAHESS